MKDCVKENLTPCLITTVVGGCMSYLYISLREFGTAELIDRYRMLCDAFSLPGMVFLLLGCLMILMNKGALNATGYLVINAAKTLIPVGERKYENYQTYLKRQEEKPKKKFVFFFMTGGVFMLISLVFLALFYSLYLK